MDRKARSSSSMPPATPAPCKALPNSFRPVFKRQTCSARRCQKSFRLVFKSQPYHRGRPPPRQRPRKSCLQKLIMPHVMVPKRAPPPPFSSLVWHQPSRGALPLNSVGFGVSQHSFPFAQGFVIEGAPRPASPLQGVAVQGYPAHKKTPTPLGTP